MALAPITLISRRCINEEMTEEAFEACENSLLEELDKQETDLIILIKDQPESTVKDAKVNVISYGVLEGKKTLWAFSSNEALFDSPPEGITPPYHTLQFKSREFFKFASQNGFEQIIIDCIFSFQTGA